MGATLPAPPSHELLESTTAWPMLANDRFNCCTSSAAGHMVHHWTQANGKGIFLTDEDVIAAQAALTGDHLLACVTMLDALKLWRNKGIGDHRIHSFLSVPEGNGEQLQQTIHLFGGAYVGLDLPAFACGPDPTVWSTTEWSVPADATPEFAAPRAQYGHCVTAIGYREEGVFAISWGTLKMMSWEFYRRYSVETYAVLSTDWVERDQRCPSGFARSALLEDLHMIAAT